MIHQNKFIGGILLVSGTTIGAGMLALPVSTGFAGFIPAIVLFAVYWIFMTYTALLILETDLWMEKNSNLITMAKNTLGKWGEGVSWVVYLFLLYSLTTAYIAGSGPIIVDFIHAITGYTIPSLLGSIPLLLAFGYFVYKGTGSVDLINRVMMLGLLITYLILVVFLTPHIEFNLLERQEWSFILIAVSVVATSFGFHIIIPTLTTYLHRDVTKIKRVIIVGSIIPLVTYIFWELITLGIIPVEGEEGIACAFEKGGSGANLLACVVGNSMIAVIARAMAFFAIVTSFLGVSLSLTDFLADGLKIKKTKKGRAILYFLTFLPPVLITLTNPRAFLTALEFAGAFGVVIILGFMPALMVWRGRYHKKFPSKYQAPGGKGALIGAMSLSVLVIIIEIYNKVS